MRVHIFIYFKPTWRAMLSATPVASRAPEGPGTLARNPRCEPKLRPFGAQNCESAVTSAPRSGDCQQPQTHRAGCGRCSRQHAPQRGGRQLQQRSTARQAEGYAPLAQHKPFSPSSSPWHLSRPLRHRPTGDSVMAAPLPIATAQLTPRHFWQGEIPHHQLRRLVHPNKYPKPSRRAATRSWRLTSPQS